jgi:hypothetical protein
MGNWEADTLWPVTDCMSLPEEWPRRHDVGSPWPPPWSSARQSLCAC